MTHPGGLIRWGALGALVLLVRAIVRESRAQRTPVILLPPTRAASRRGAGAVDLDVAEEATAESGPKSGRATKDLKPARE